MRADGARCQAESSVTVRCNEPSALTPAPFLQKAGSAMSEDTPVLDTLVAITAVSVEEGTLEAREHMLVRLAALVAVDAPAGSYLLNLGTAVDVGVTLEDVQGVLIAVAPVVGTPRIVSAAENIAEAFGIVV